MSKLTQKKQSKSSKKIRLPLFTYFCLLLMVASLCTGVTYARYVSQSQGIATTGVVPMACSFSIDEISSLAFANSDYLVEIEGFHKVMNAPRSIAFSVRNYEVDAEGNKSSAICDVALQCTLRVFATKEFLDNVAFQIVQKDISNAPIPLTQQYILTDIIKAAQDGTGPISTETAWKASKDPATNKDFGEIAGRPEEIITVTNDGFSNENDAGKIVAVAQTADEHKDLVSTISITPEKHDNIPYSVEFMRGKPVQVGDGNDMSAPAYNADCVASEVEYYCVDITLPALTLEANREVSEQFQFYFTLMGKQNTGGMESTNLSFEDFKQSLQGDGTNPPTSSLTGEHFNVLVPTYTDSACTQIDNSTATVRVHNTLAGDGSITSTEYYYVHNLLEEKMTVSDTDNVASCTVEGKTIYVRTQYNHDFHGETKTYNLNDYKYNHSEGNQSYVIGQLVGRSYPVDVCILFTQASQTASR